jgi:hypothetical protein
LGLAIKPQRRARALTTGVKAAAKAKDTKGGTSLSGVTKNMNQIRRKKSYSIGGLKARRDSEVGVRPAICDPVVRGQAFDSAILKQEVSKPSRKRIAESKA